MDANAKLGPELIKSDPNQRSGNGELLIELCERNNLVICNTTYLCQGVITRQRVTVNGVEKRKDYFILWLKSFKNILHQSFKKIRITNKQINNVEVPNLMNAKSKIAMKMNEIQEMLNNSGNFENESQIFLSLQEAIDTLIVWM